MINQQARDFLVSAAMPEGSEEPLIRDLHLLSSFAGRWIVLIFHPLAFTFVSPTEIAAFSELADNFDALNAQVLAISCDSKYTQLSWMKKMGGSRIPLVSDFNKEVAAAYGVLLDDGVAARATVIISPARVVRYISLVDLAVGRNAHEVVRLLMALQHVDRYEEDCPANWQPGNKSQFVSPELAKTYFSALKEPDRVDQVKQLLKRSFTCIIKIITEIEKKYKISLQTQPLLTKSITSAAIGALGEIIGGWVKAGRREEKRSISSILRSVDIKRIIIFASYGGIITGPLFHVWYGFLERFVGKYNLPFTASLGLKLALNQLVLTPPFLLFTLIYLNFMQSFKSHEAMKAARNTFALALYTNWKVWTPAQAVNFTIVPLDYRVVYGNIVALWWNLYLSLVS